MLKSTLIATSQSVSNASLTKMLLDGTSFYGFAQFDRGKYGFGFYGFYSEGQQAPYGQGAPAWGSFAMFSNGVLSQSYTDEWDLTGASAPTTYSVVSGSLPNGLNLTSVSGNTGRISGTPTVAGTFNFTLRATNAYGTADKAFSITIVTPPAGGGGAWAFVA